MLNRFFLFICFAPVLAHASTGDTLDIFLAKIKHDSASVRHLISVSDRLSLNDETSALKVAQRAMEIAYETKIPQTISDAALNLGIRFASEGEYIKAGQNLFVSLRISDSLHDNYRQLRSLNSIGNLYSYQFQLDAATGYYEKALAIAIKLNNRERQGVILGNLGGIFYQKADDDSVLLKKALSYYEKSLKIAEEENKPLRIISISENMILVFTDLKQYERALNLAESTLIKIKLAEDSSDLSNLLSNVGRIYREQGEYDKALNNFSQSLQISKKMNNRIMVSENYLNLASIYELKGDYKNAFTYFKFHKELDDSLINISNTEIIADLKSNIEASKKQNEIEELKQKNEIGDLRNGRQNLFLGITVVGLILLGAFAFLLFNRARVKDKLNKTLENKNQIIAEKNKDITDSINYAKRIQESLFASEKDMQLLLPEFFILFKPRDIVSGDFWWITKKENKIFLCVADCTGHGVPGAFMSLLAISFLNEAVVEKGIYQPKEIFDHVRSRIISSLSSENSSTSNSDGMDGVLFCVDTISKKSSFVCANNPVWIERSGKLIEFRPDKMPVGKHHGPNLPFTVQEITLEKNDVVYLLSDGYADQFGGEQGKKFKYKALQQLLTEHSGKSMNDKKIILEKTFDNWKGSLEQVDDVLLIGFKI